ncbi:hypothetical protein AAFF_G00137040 [Aldrovandia affinis]|uniref:Uncharacterized protein n=1 Tax=Aldrovandia affinis TaxID=143900 RepID=A0AAD7TBR2_9TELE|nr:hypothetical protein AAFF_G00137040 [Aldrovandia affinis]
MNGPEEASSAGGYGSGGRIGRIPRTPLHGQPASRLGLESGQTGTAPERRRGASRNNQSAEQQLNRPSELRIVLRQTLRLTPRPFRGVLFTAACR